MTPTDLLASAVAAARTVAEDGADDGAATRLRIRESLAKRGSKKRLWTLLAAAIGTMFASTAFALQAGWEPPWSSHTEAVAPAAPDPDPPSTPDAPRRTAALSSGPSTTVRFEAVPPLPSSGSNQAVAEEAPLLAPPVASEPTPVRTSEPPAVAAAEPPTRTDAQPRTPSVAPPPGEPAPSRVPSADSSRRTGAIDPPGASIEPAPVAPAPSTDSAQRSGSIERPAVTPAPDAELAAYRTAHTLHFRGNDPKAALAAWDALLAKFPSGRLAPEARFNRALTLIKLERWSDARAALAPFAAGGYREKEAKQLLDAIAGR